MTKSIKNQSGITLVLSLLVLTVVTAVAVSLSIIIINEIITTRGISYSVKSFYSAEAAIEQGLWLVKDLRQEGNTIEQVQTALDGDSGYLDADQKVGWSRQADVELEMIEFDLRQDASAFFDLYNRGGNPPYKISLDWETCGGGGENIEASWTAWNPSDGFDTRSTKQYPVSINTDITLTNDLPTPPATNFRLQIRAFDNCVNNINITVKDVGGNPISIPSAVRITTIGEYPSDSPISSSQAIQADVPWIIPISGIYSYVIYSEQPLIKE